MATIVHGTFIFGIPPQLPALPVGWVYLAEKDNWLKARDKQGTEYYIATGKAYPEFRGESGLPLVDMRNPVPLPTSSTDH